MTEPYRAFGISGEKIAGVDIRRPRRGLGIPYSLIRGVSYDNRAEGKGIFLNLADGVRIQVRGRNLHAVARALISETCTFIEERDPERAGPPADGEPDIERIHPIDPMSRVYAALEEPQPKGPEGA